MVWRRRDMGRRSSLRPEEARGFDGTWAGAAGAAGRGGSGWETWGWAAAGAGDFSTYACTSSLVIRPPLPVGDTLARSTPVSCARRWANGVANTGRAGADSDGEVAAAGATASA